MAQCQKLNPWIINSDRGKTPDTVVEKMSKALISRKDIMLADKEEMLHQR
jgi:hypothetical protein